MDFLAFLNSSSSTFSLNTCFHVITCFLMSSLCPLPLIETHRRHKEYIHIHTLSHLHTYTLTHTLVHTYIHLHSLFTYTQTRTHQYTYTHLSTHMYSHIHSYTYTHLDTYVHSHWLTHINMDEGPYSGTPTTPLTLHVILSTFSTPWFRLYWFCWLMESWSYHRKTHTMGVLES